MPMTSQEMIKLLLKNGFAIISQNGSHVKLKNTDTHKTVIVPYHCKDIKKYAKLTLPIVSFCVSLYNNLGISSGRSAVRPYRQCLGSPY